ncbi:fructosamine kinase family protein [Candidatus Bathyarchaeota archaeon]|nr:fructosamine kinase family protein [Candidatus Bathyarchaeota archaeon]
MHEDLWHNNVGTDGETGKVVLYGPDAWYAHREFELRIWRCDFVELGEKWLGEYLTLFPESEPKADFEDRHRLYSLKFNISHSFHWPSGSEKARKRRVFGFSFPSPFPSFAFLLGEMHCYPRTRQNRDQVFRDSPLYFLH